MKSLDQRVALAADAFHFKRGRRPTHFTVSYEDKYEMASIIADYERFTGVVTGGRLARFVGLEFAGFTDQPEVCVSRMEPILPYTPPPFLPEDFEEEDLVPSPEGERK